MFSIIIQCFSHHHPTQNSLKVTKAIFPGSTLQVTTLKDIQATSSDDVLT